MMLSIHRIFKSYTLLDLLVALRLILKILADSSGRICIIFRASQGLKQHLYLSLRTLVINSRCVSHNQLFADFSASGDLPLCHFALFLKINRYPGQLKILWPCLWYGTFVVSTVFVDFFDRNLVQKTKIFAKWLVFFHHTFLLIIPKSFTQRISSKNSYCLILKASAVFDCMDYEWMIICWDFYEAIGSLRPEYCSRSYTSSWSGSISSRTPQDWTPDPPSPAPPSSATSWWSILNDSCVTLGSRDVDLLGSIVAVLPVVRREVDRLGLEAQSDGGELAERRYH